MIVKKDIAQNSTELLVELFKTHGFESEEHEGWIIPEGSDYAMKGYWYPDATENTGQLTIELFIDSEMIMVESFAGLGESASERLQSAFGSFLHHSAPTFLLAVWGIVSSEVETQSWSVGGETYTAYIGKQGVMNYDKTKELEIPASYQEKVKELILSESSDKAFATKVFHWFNLFYANMNGLDTYAEVIKDNIKWNAGETALKSLSWARSNHYYAVRQFVILKKS